MAKQTSLRMPRGRPREFDMDAAVERAMGVFWSRGYHGTSLPDLLKATELSRGSLYAAFGDKHGLFLHALERYIDDALARLDENSIRGKARWQACGRVWPVMSIAQAASPESEDAWWWPQPWSWRLSSASGVSLERWKRGWRRR